MLRKSRRAGTPDAPSGQFLRTPGAPFKLRLGGFFTRGAAPSRNESPLNHIAACAMLN